MAIGFGGELLDAVAAPCVEGGTDERDQSEPAPEQLQHGRPFNDRELRQFDRSKSSPSSQPDLTTGSDVADPRRLAERRHQPSLAVGSEEDDRHTMQVAGATPDPGQVAISCDHQL